MSSFVFFLTNLATEKYFFTYLLLLYICIILFGNIFCFVGFWIAFHAKLGISGMLVIFAITYLANVSGDFLWFNLGRLLRDTKLGYFILDRFAKKNLKAVETLNKKGTIWFAFSKFFFAGGIFAFVLGWSEKELKKFMKSSFIISIFAVLIVCGLSFGIVLGLMPLSTLEIFNKLEVLFIIGVVLFIVLEYIISKIAKKVLFSNKNNNLSELSENPNDSKDSKDDII